MTGEEGNEFYKVKEYCYSYGYRYKYKPLTVKKS